MSSITTENIENGIRQGERLNLIACTEALLAGRPLRLSEMAVTLSSKHCKQIERLASAAVAGFGIDEPTFVAMEHGLPTLLTRVDCTITENGIALYENDERPAGIGLTDAIVRRANEIGIMSAIKQHFGLFAGELPLIVRHPEAAQNDDSLVFEVAELGDSVPKRPLIARGEPHHFLAHQLLEPLRAQSMSTVTSEGSKQYLIGSAAGNARIMHNADSIDATKSFVLKPEQGSKGHGVMVYLAPLDREKHGKHGTVTFERARRAIEQHAGRIILQDFLPPVPTNLPEGAKGNTILRIFTLVHPGNRIQVIDGTYVSRPELVVHGASNSVAGPLLVEYL